MVANAALPGILDFTGDAVNAVTRALTLGFACGEDRATESNQFIKDSEFFIMADPEQDDYSEALGNFALVSAYDGRPVQYDPEDAEDLDTSDWNLKASVVHSARSDAREPHLP